jgi:Tol biopolymer transport system component/DNA-binding winged helix-turn-helix (wHTH) protein
MSHSGKSLLAFGAFELDRAEGLLFRGGELVPLPPKSLRTLVVLIESGGRLMTKDELMKAIWPDTFVEEHNLTLNIHILRKALNTPGGPEGYIETIPRRGYRFIASVHEPPVAPEKGDNRLFSRKKGTTRVAWTLLLVTAVVAVAGAAASRLFAGRTNIDAGPDLVRLTDNVADDHQPDVSPDGRHIVFVSNRDGGKGEIYVMDAGGTHPRNLTNDPGNDDTPAWSPDGRRIAFESDRRGPIEIFVMDADGSHQTPLAPGARAAWSPDGRHLAYQCLVDGHSEIFTIDANGGTPRRLTFDRDFDGDPSWSPDGAALAFTSSKGDRLQIDVMRLDGGGRTALTNAGNNSLPSWSPDNRILFTSDREGMGALYVMEADGALQHRVEEGQSAEGGWWPGGHAVVFQSERDGNSEIYRLRLTHEPDGAVRLTRHVGDDDFPVWSADGRSIAFESNRDGKPNVFVMDADGGNVRNISRSGAADLQPAWSGDGRRIAFATDRAGGFSIDVMNVDGSSVTRVTSGPHDSAPRWSPDGSSLCFSRDLGIWITPVEVDAGAPRRIADGISCAWSSDGSRLIVDRDEDGTRQIYSVAVAGNDSIRLTSPGHGNGGPAVSRDGSRIAFNSNQDGFGFGIFVMAPDGTSQTRVTGWRTFDEHAAWSADGKWIAFTSNRDGNLEIYKVPAPAGARRPDPATGNR